MAARKRTVIHYTDTAGFGGAETGLLTLLGGLDRDRWEPVLFHHANTGVAPLVERTRKLGIETREVPTEPGSRDWRWLRRFGRLIRSKRPSVFHAHLVWPLACTYGLVAAALFRVPAVVATQQLFAPVRTSHDRRLHKLVSLGVGRHIAVSDNMAGELRPLVFRPNRVVVIHNSVSANRFRGAALVSLRESLTKGARPLVLTLSRLDPQKGLPFLIEAAKLVPEAMFVVAGEGRDRRALEEQSRSLVAEGRLMFLGHRDDIPDLLAACDLFVLPSLFEGLPISVLEAMAAGKPVVATRIGGTDEAVVDGLTGVLVPARDPVALAGAVRQIFADPVAARRMGEAGRARILSDFSAETMVNRTTRLYEELLG